MRVNNLQKLMREYISGCIPNPSASLDSDRDYTINIKNYLK